MTVKTRHQPVGLYVVWSRRLGTRNLPPVTLKCSTGGDGYMMKHIIHSWDDERAALILRNTRAAMKRGGRLILIVGADAEQPRWLF